MSNLRLRIDDEVDVALAVAQLVVGEAVELLGQRPQRLHEEADRARVHGELALHGLEEVPFHADDVAEIPVLEVLVAATSCVM